MTWLLHTDPVPLRVDDGGNVRVGTTRVTLHTLVAQFNAGATPEELVVRFDTLRLADVYSVLGYYLRHRDEIDAQLAEGDRAADERLRGMGAMVRRGAEVRVILEARLAQTRGADNGTQLSGG